jgi:hypothetical protein
VLKYAALEMLDAWRQPSAGGISRVAHRVAFHYDPRPGYLYVRSRMISSRTNDNHDTFPADEIEKGYRTFLGKPVFVNHNNANHRRARGVIVAVALHRDRTRDGNADTWVEGLMEVDAVKFPKLAKAILEGKVNRTSMGVDVDWSTCSACGNKATSPAEYCKHLPAQKGRKIRQRNKKTGKVEERLIHEICAGLSFFENSLLVEDPADPTAAVLGTPDARGMEKAASRRTAASEPDFRDHIPNSCLNCGDPVAFLPASRNGKYPDRWKHDSGRLYDHDADPERPELRNPKMLPSAFGGTRCAVCGEDVKINLRSLHTSTGGWHHHDGMLRDHPAVPLNPQAVYDSVPGTRAAMDQARQQVRDHLHSQFEQIEGRPLPRQPRGDEAQMPPDPFTAAKKREGGDHPFFHANPVSKQHIVDSYHGSTDDEKALGNRWYADAHHVATAIAGGDTAKGAGLLSAYSPRTAWPVNMFNASRAAQGEPPGPGSGAMGTHQRAAIRILAGEHHSKVLKEPKTAAFAHLIEHGGDTPEDEKSGKGKVVIDRHAMSVAMGRRVSDEDDAPLGQHQHYEHVAQLYRDAAHDISKALGRKVSPHQVQATTWLHQIRKNNAEDAAATGRKGASAKGRATRTENARETWRHHHPHAHPGGIPEENMHHKGTRKLAYGETRVPPQVDTLRMDECPVCGEHNVWSGSRCPVCGFVVPPSVFRDPDTDKARQVRDQLDDTGEVTEDPQNPQDPGMGQEPIGSGDDADDQLTHPDQIAPDGVPIVQGEGGPVPGEEDDGQEGPPPEGDGQPEDVPDDTGEEDQLPEDDDEEPGDELECPACGTTFEPDAYAQPGMPCPACGMANLHPIDESDDGGDLPPGDEDPGGGDEGDGPQKDQEDDPSAPGDEKEEDEDMPAKTGAALAQAQARRIAEQSAHIEALSAQLRYLASAAGVGRELDEVGRRVMRRHADILNPASPVPDPPEGPPSETTEQALMPEAMDDPSRPGATPGANSRVPAAQTTTAITPGVEMQTPPATNLVDVTAPVQGTNPSQDGGVPLSQRRIETDVRIDPDPLKAHGPGIGGQGDNGAAFPWLLDAQMPGQQQGQGGQPGQGQRAASLHPQEGEAESSRRTFGAIRLAKLRVQAGLAQGDELSVAERIERDASLSTPMIEHDISTLEQLGRSGAMGRSQPPVQRQAARSAPSLASVGASSQYAPAVADDLDGSDIFL